MAEASGWWRRFTAAFDRAVGVWKAANPTLELFVTQSDTEAIESITARSPYGGQSVTVALDKVVRVVRVRIVGQSRSLHDSRVFVVEGGALALEQAASPEEATQQCLERWFEQLT